ncbi:MAG: response regulator [Spartobacteria bacterium]|nr:response regulator [Spartobacteria bacterium]
MAKSNDLHKKSRARVLVVDDSDFIRWGLRSELQSAGYDVLEASSGQDAIKKMITEPHLSAVTMGLQMQGMTGFDIIEAIRSDAYLDKLVHIGNENVPVIFITSNDNEADRMRGFALGAVDFVLKKNVRGNIVRIIGDILKPSEELSDVHILVVDDSRTTRTVVSACLKELGVQVHDADDGRRAQELLKTSDVVMDLVLTDLYMPDMSGDELCRYIRADHRHKDVPVIFLSGHGHRPIIELFKMGATDYLRKPFIKEELKARVEAHLRRQQLTRRLQGQIEELEGLNALKDQFLTVCSHDLRSPINGIIGFCKMMRKETALTDEQEDMLANMLVAGEHLLTLIGDILDLGRMQKKKSEMEFSELELLQVIQTCIKTMRYSASLKGVELELVTGSLNPYVSGNQSALLRIFNNVISNAIKFSHTNSKVSILITVNRKNQCVKVDVKDQGVGIPSRMIDHVFDKYTKTSRTGTAGEPGTGLGMAITRELLDTHQGAIRLRSEEGKGTDVCIELPLAKVESITPPRHDVHQEVQELADAADDGNIDLNILVAEDNAVISIILKKLLTSFGCRFEIVSDGLKALETYRDCFGTAPFDVILMDLEMPVMDGMTAAQEIREFESDLLATSGAETFHPIPIIALTAHVDDAIISQCHSCGMNGHLRKPVEKDDLRAVIRQYACSKSLS